MQDHNTQNKIQAPQISDTQVDPTPHWAVLAAGMAMTFTFGFAMVMIGILIG